MIEVFIIASLFVLVYVLYRVRDRQDMKRRQLEDERRRQQDQLRRILVKHPTGLSIYELQKRHDYFYPRLTTARLYNHLGELRARGWVNCITVSCVGGAHEQRYKPTGTAMRLYNQR